MSQKTLMIFSVIGSGLAPLSRAFRRLRETHLDLLHIHVRSGENLFDKKQEQEALELALRADEFSYCPRMRRKKSCPPKSRSIK
jgi:hypothetical protein